MELTHTIKRYGGVEAASMGGLGTVTADPVVRVRWNDARDTALIVSGIGRTIMARAYHAGVAYDLRPVAGDLETVTAHWIAAITRRLQAKRLQDRVRGGIDRGEITARVHAWNRELGMNRAA